MNKNGSKGSGIIIGVMPQGGREAEYRINGVRYLVSSKFTSPEQQEQTTISTRMENLLRSDFSRLTPPQTNDTIKVESVCSAQKERSEV